jgi:hypothetical protein
MNLGKLKRIESVHANMRTSEMPGYFFQLPAVGERFKIFGQPIDSAAEFRVISTSEVWHVQHLPGVVRFATQNSSYELEYAK